MKNELEKTLANYSIKTLNSIVEYRGIDPGQANKETIIKLLASFMADRKQIQKMEEQLSPVQKAVLHVLLNRSGKASYNTIQKHLLKKELINVSGKPNLYRNEPSHKASQSGDLDSVMANLLARGLVFSGTEREPGMPPGTLTFSRVSIYTIPEPVRKHLKPPPPEPPWTPPEANAPARIIEGSARTFQRDLYLYWSFVRQNPVEMTTKGNIQKRILVALNNTLLVREEIKKGQGEEDFHRLMFIRTVLLTLGLIDDQGPLLQAKADASFFEMDPLQRIRTTHDAYLRFNRLNEIKWLARVRQYFQMVEPAPMLVLDARQAVVNQLKHLKGWVPITALVERMADDDYEFLFTRRLSPNNYYNQKYHAYSAQYNPAGWEFPDIYSDDTGWKMIEARFIEMVVRDFLFWMGLVDLGYSSSDAKAPDVFRLTPVGAWLLAGGPAPEIPTERGQIIVQPDYTVTAFDPVSDAVLHKLDQFAQRISAERAVVYRLTQGSVYAGQKKGWDAAQIKRTLEDLTEQPLPQNVARSLDEWQSWHERIRIRPNLTVLTAADPQDLENLALNKELGKYFLEKPVSGAAILPAESDAEVIRLLIEYHWMPEIIPPDAGPPAKSVRINADGQLIFKVPAPDLYLKAFLARFAEPDSSGYRITRTSIRKAIASGIKAPQILQDLQYVADAAIPAEIQRIIQAWSGHFGSAAVQDVLLLQFKDPKVLKELLVDPELHDLLTPLQPEEISSTVKVRPEDRQRLIRLLEERGIDLR
jgi:hypothetical protein